MYTLAICCTIAFCSCNHGDETRQAVQTACKKTSSLPVKYARGFSVDYYDGFKVITVRDWMDSSKAVLRYVVLAAGKPLPVGFETDLPIEAPVHKIGCISVTHVAEMAKVGLIDSIAAVTNVDLIYDSVVRNKVKQQQIADVGAQEIDYEKLLALHPAFVFSSGDYDGGGKMKLKLDALHIKSVLNLEYKEQDPLGRAEWIKFIAAFYNREDIADSIFKQVEKNYLDMKAKVAGNIKRPTVLCNLPFKEIWYMPCKGNYITQLLDDAGSDFIWKDEGANNRLNLSLDYESVYSKAANADYWINPGIANSLAEIKSVDKKNTFFKAFKTGNIYNDNKRNTARGGFDFWESGAVNPDKILADLIYIFHPELLQGYELYYYQKLK